MAYQTSTQKAQALFDQIQPMVEAARKMGMTVSGIKAATLDELIAHVTRCDELSAKYHCTMDPVALWGQDLEARALAKARVLAGRRGVKALEAKYGHEIAARIVYDKSGKHIR